jgi:hypothetical protein
MYKSGFIGIRNKSKSIWETEWSTKGYPVTTVGGYKTHNFTKVLPAKKVDLALNSGIIRELSIPGDSWLEIREVLRAVSVKIRRN